MQLFSTINYTYSHTIPTKQIHNSLHKKHAKWLKASFLLLSNSPIPHCMRNKPFKNKKRRTTSRDSFCEKSTKFERNQHEQTQIKCLGWTSVKIEKAKPKQEFHTSSLDPVP